jgi:hypothetical protein
MVFSHGFHSKHGIGSWFHPSTWYELIVSLYLMVFIVRFWGGLYLYEAPPSLFHGWKSIGRLVLAHHLVWYFFFFGGQVSNVLIEGFWHIRDIEERAIAKQVRYDFIYVISLLNLRLFISIRGEYLGALPLYFDLYL